MSEVAANQGASLGRYAPFSWPGGSMVVDYDGRILARADPGPGEKIVVAPVDIGALRHERERRSGYQGLVHLRSEAYPMYCQRFFPPGRLTDAADHTVEENQRTIAAVKERLRGKGD